MENGNFQQFCGINILKCRSNVPKFVVFVLRHNQEFGSVYATFPKILKKRYKTLDNAENPIDDKF